MAKKFSYDFNSVFNVSERELVNPKLSYWDKKDLYGLLLDDIEDFVKEKNMGPYNGMNREQLEEAVEKIFPKYMMYDTYNINETPTESIELGVTDESNQWLFDFLMNRATGYYTKTVTQNNPFNSYIYSSEILKQLLLMYQQENPQGPAPQDGEGKSGKGQSGIEKMLRKMQGNQKGNQKLDQAMEKAQQEADQRIKDTEKTGETTGDLGCDKGMGDFSLGDIKEFMDYTEALEHISLDETTVSSFVKNTLKLSESYFSTKYTETQLEFLEADVIDDLQGVEFLIPQLRAVGLEDVVTHERKYHMKFDIFIDISGSMDSRMYNMSKKGNSSDTLRGIDLAKITAIKLKNLGHVEDVYPFESRVHKKLTDKADIARMRVTGGTDIDRVIRQVEETDRPSVVITDMQDSISVYSPNVFFVGILGASFESFRHSDVGKQYLANHQCIKYNEQNAFVLAH
jgi:hypothetical protein